MKETKELQLVQQATTAEIKQNIADIGVKTQEQAERTLLQELHIDGGTRTSYRAIVTMHVGESGCYPATGHGCDSIDNIGPVSSSICANYNVCIRSKDEGGRVHSFPVAAIGN